jgi:phospholipase/carboxylesterase
MMNRLQAESFAIVPNTIEPKFWQTIGQCSGGKFSAAQQQYSHALFAPLHYEQNYGYPLIVWLHGSGDSERQLRRIMPLISLRNYVAGAPRGTVEMPQRAGGNRGYQWSQTPEQVALAEQAVNAAILEAQRRMHIRADRIFLAGYESGGTMAFRIAVERPDLFAGVLSLCGPFPERGAPLANLNAVRQLPVFVAACRNGSYYATPQVCDNLRLFHVAGISITLREYPGPDGLSQQMLADVDRWIMDQISSPAALSNAAGPKQTGVG